MTESATVTAVRLGLAWKRSASGATLTNDQLLDLAVAAYWRNRKTVAAKGLPGVAKRAGRTNMRENGGAGRRATAPRLLTATPDVDRRRLS